MTANKYYLKSVGNALKIINLFQQQRRSLTITDIVNLSGLDRASVNRIVYTLTNDAYLVKRDRKYNLSDIFLQLSNAYLQSSNIMQDIRSEMEFISNKHGEATFLFADKKDRYILIDWYVPKGASYSRSQMGETLPHNCSSVGKVFLSQYDDETIRSIVARDGFFRSTERSICEVEPFLDEIHFVQKNGYAACVGEYMLETGALGVPIYNNSGAIVFAISFCYGSSMTNERLEKVIPDLLAVSKSLSKLSNRKQ